MPTTTTATEWECGKDVTGEWECGKGVTGVAEEAIKPSLETSVTGHTAVSEHPLQAICGRLEIRNLPQSPLLFAEHAVHCLQEFYI